MLIYKVHNFKKHLTFFNFVPNFPVVEYSCVPFFKSFENFKKQQPLFGKFLKG